MKKKAKKTNSRTTSKKRIVLTKKGVASAKALAYRSKKTKKVLAKKKPVKKAAKKTVKKPIKRAQVETQSADIFPVNALFKAKIKVIGIGGGGGSIVSDIGRSLHKATFVVADTDARAFKRRQGIKQFLFGQQLTHGLGTGLNVDLAKEAALGEKEELAKLFKDQDIIIFIASLGGGLGSGATQVFAEAAKEFGGITFGIFTMPFKFEGKNKHKIANKALQDLRKSLNVSITIPNERIFKIIQPDTAITDAFSMVNRSLVESLESLIDLIYSPGVINIDFADLRAILKGRGNMAFLNTAEASGADRADKIIHGILHNPLYQSNNFTPEKVLFNIAGGGNLSMLEVDKISRSISEHNQSAKIIFGISKDVSLKNKIKTTLLMTGSPLGQKPEVVEEVAKVTKETKAAKVAKPVKKAPEKKAKAKPRKVAPKPQAPVNVPATLIPVFNQQPVEAVAKRMTTSTDVHEKKAIRRSALEIKNAEKEEENKRTKQEEEWEIPAFLRFKK